MPPKTKLKMIKMYEALIKPRLIEEKMLLLLRQGKVSKWFSGIGQEAISVGITLALEEDEFIFPLHRNLGVFTTRNVPLESLFCQLQGKANGFSKGRERSFHFGIPQHHIIGMISHLGPQMALADGVALSHKLKKEKKVSVAFSGEGGTSEGDFHEAINVAAVWDLPVLFVVENNGYGLSTPSKDQFRCEHIADRAIGYGIEGHTIDGNDFAKVYETAVKLTSSMRKDPRPILLECMTFRMRGHEEASGTKYVPKELFEEWGKKDPIARYEKELLRSKDLTPKLKEEITERIKGEIEEALEVAFKDPDPIADTTQEIAEVYRPCSVEIIAEGSSKSEKRFVDAISDGLKESMKRHSSLVLLGQDIGDYGGVFKVTEGFIEEFGKDRVRNTPLCESAIVGAALGLSIAGHKSMVEMQFADFVTCGFNQIVNNLAKVHWRWGQNADVVVRMPTGAGTGAGPFHSQSNEAWFTHVPGLKVVYPSTPYDAKGLLIRSFDDPNPVIFFEHKLLYRSLREEVPDGPYSIELGQAKIVQKGEDVAIVTYGMGVHWAKQWAQNNPEVSCYILDLRTLLPMDKDSIAGAVRHCGKVLILHEDTLFGGIGGEISAFISESCFSSLDAPVMRVGSLDTPIPFAANLERNFLANNWLSEKMNKLLAY